MKHTYLPFFLFFLTGLLPGVQAQNPGYILDSVYFSLYDADISDYVYSNRKYYTVHDNNLNPTFVLQQNWDPVKAEFNNRFLNTYTFGSDGFLYQRTQQIWGGDLISWENRGRYTYEGDQNGENTLFVKDNWGNNNWEETVREQYTNTYDIDGKPLEVIGEKWQDIEFVLHSRRSFSYIGDLRNEQVTQAWFLTDWINVERHLYTYTATEKIDTETRQNWNPAVGDWQHRRRLLYQYDAEEVPEIVWFEQWDPNAKTWMPIGRWDYYWTKDLSSVENPEAEEAFCLIPNPLVIGTTIHCDQLEPGRNYQLSVYNLLGQKVLVCEFQGDRDLEFQHPIPAGLYLLSLETSEKILEIQKVFIHP